MSAAAQLPPGERDQDQSATVLGVAIAFLIFNTVITAIRPCTAYLTKLPIRANDYVALASYAATLSLIAIIIAMVEDGGLGRHTATLSVDQDIEYGKLAIGYSILYFWASGLPKVVMLLMYFRIFTSRAYRVATWVLIGLVISYCLSNTIVTLTSCIPLSKNWDPTVTEAQCIDILSWWRWSTLPNSLLDLIIMMLPIPQVVKLKLSLRDRLGLVFIFTAGGAGFVASIIRLAFFLKTDGVVDTQWTGVELVIAALVETATYIAAINLPAIRTVLLFGQRKGQFSRSGYSRNHGADGMPSDRRTPRKSFLGTDSATDPSAIYPGSWSDARRKGSDEEVLTGTQASARGQRPHDDALHLESLAPTRIHIQTDVDVSS